MIVTCHENIFLNSNSYLIQSYDKLVLIDPSDEDSFIEKVTSLKVPPEYIILTHEHIDHITGINKVKSLFKNVLIISSKFTASAILDSKKNLSIFHGFHFIGTKVDFAIDRYSRIKLSDNFTIDFYPCFGHSLGGLFIIINDFIFCGDEFIYKKKTITKLPGGNKAELENSFTFLKMNFKNDMILYPGHGNNFFLKELKIW